MSDSRELSNIIGFDTSLFLCVFFFLMDSTGPKDCYRTFTYLPST